MVPGAGATGACVLPTSDTSFLVVGGRSVPDQVVEYDTLTDTWSQWPELERPRHLLSCARLGDVLVIGGGEEDTSTTLLDLVTKEQRPGGQMTTSRGDYFRMVNFGGRVLAVGGDDGESYLDSVEEWLGEGEGWRLAQDRLQTARYAFSALVAPREMVCGPEE